VARNFVRDMRHGPKIAVPDCNYEWKEGRPTANKKTAAKAVSVT